MRRVYNFNPGPAALPYEVLVQARQELVDFAGSGMSVLELSHRSSEYDLIHNQAAQLVRRLLKVPDDYHILFLQGGASLQFAMVPLNLLPPGKTANYILTGIWSEKAVAEARKIGQVQIGATTADEEYRRIPRLSEIRVNSDAAYVHLTSNNTIMGTQWPEFPRVGEVPLIADMSSDILSRPIDVKQFGLIYAGAQKNLGPAGVTVVIIREDLLSRGAEEIPTLLNYRTHAAKNSLYHTPPTFAIYMLKLVLEWVERQRPENIYRDNAAKAALLYQVIDESQGFYRGYAEQGSRSPMNVTFQLPTEELTEAFAREAEEKGLVGLKGHRTVGGCRASLYNAVSQEAVQALVEFMTEFRRRH